ncbi:hypothetical protein GCM10025874_22510 [Arenivirga flava]|uniref:alpha-L-rhamnosidase n=1 Tax=Arenivirga flava TaxID=1930060 RepID=A0AA37UEM7_9MICO|nr:family 78 glycoside hydrolase catalytic domain [Arenivirga flava]GMA28998.1 hypothetical protein GCM10025874_22510 [Arenivirga flava]
MSAVTPRIDGVVRFEHLDEPLGIGSSRPRLSWRLDAAPGWTQRAYELELHRGGAVHGTGLIETADQVLVPWPGAPLSSRERATVRVRAHGTDGTSTAWSEAAEVEAGLLSAADWRAVPVGGAWPERAGTDRRPSRVRRSFVLDHGIASARLYASAHGVYEAELNGQRIGDDVLSPGWTKYDTRLRYRTYDVTGMLLPGENVIGAWLGDGWYRGRLGFNGGYHDLYGEDLAFIGQLEVRYSDGRSEIIATDGAWEAAKSPILFSGLYDGEQHDLRLDGEGWSSPGGSDEGWAPVAIGRRDPSTLTAPVQPPVRCTEEVEPASMRRDSTGALLIDFGQNLVGRLRIRIHGRAGQEIRITHAEVLQDGELYRRTLRLAASEDVVTLASDGLTEWEPRFTIHGFRYARIEGWDGEPSAGDIVARVHHTDMRRTGWFSSSDPSLDRLHENVLWSTRSNFVDIPTDCPQRDERLGWTGDIQVFAPTAAFLYDCAGMLDSWLVDLAEEQLEDGTVPWFVPTIPGGSTWNPIKPGAVWGDAAVLTPGCCTSDSATSASWSSSTRARRPGSI